MNIYNNKMNLFFSIEGNIGVGKSTLIEYLKKNLDATTFKKNIVYLDEPIKEWVNITNENNSTLLEEYYKDNKKYAFSFQINALISRICQIKYLVENESNTIFIMERSIHTDYNVFCKMLKSQNYISEIDFKIYLRWYNEFSSSLLINGFIYLRGDNDKMIENIKKRDRNGEENISKEYINLLSEYHDNWLLKNNCEKTNIIVIEQPMEVLKGLSLIRNFINEQLQNGN